MKTKKNKIRIKGIYLKVEIKKKLWLTAPKGTTPVN